MSAYPKVVLFALALLIPALLFNDYAPADWKYWMERNWGYVLGLPCVYFFLFTETGYSELRQVRWLLWPIGLIVGLFGLVKLIQFMAAL